MIRKYILFNIIICVSFFYSNQILLADEIAGYTSELELIKHLSPSGGDYLNFREKPYVDRSGDLNTLKQEIEAKIQAAPDEPVNYILLGLTYRNITTNDRQTRLKGIPRNEYFKSDEFLKMMELASSAYLKAFKLDKQNKPPKLTEDMVYWITQDALFPVDAYEQTVRYEMGLRKHPPTETYYRDSFQAMYEAYVQAERYEDALRILDEMQQKFPKMQNDIEQARSGISAIMQEDEDKDKTPIAEQTAVNEQQPKPSTVKEQPPQPPTPPTEHSTAAPPGAESGITRNILILALLAIGLVVILYVIRRPRKQ